MQRSGPPTVATPQPYLDSVTTHVPGIAYALRGVTKLYGSGDAIVTALAGVDLTIHRGEMIILLGPSGSGNSTFLNILGGLDSPTGGSVRFQGEELAGMDEAGLTRFRRRHIGFVFQFYNLIPSLTALENVELVGEVADDPLDAAEALAMVGLGRRLQHFPAELSGGEQQRVAIARAIAKRPNVLLCDEPTGALDIHTGVQVLQALTDANRTSGATTLIVTHNADIARLGDRVIRFADGAIRNIERNAVRVPASELNW
jgi:putative ABC transport system ATP-binding protein